MLVTLPAWVQRGTTAPGHPADGGERTRTKGRGESEEGGTGGKAGRAGAGLRPWSRCRLRSGPEAQAEDTALSAGGGAGAGASAAGGPR